MSAVTWKRRPLMLFTDALGWLLAFSFWRTSASWEVWAGCAGNAPFVWPVRDNWSAFVFASRWPTYKQKSILLDAGLTLKSTLTFVMGLKGLFTNLKSRSCVLNDLVFVIVFVFVSRVSSVLSHSALVWRFLMVVVPNRQCQSLIFEWDNSIQTFRTTWDILSFSNQQCWTYHPSFYKNLFFSIYSEVLGAEEALSKEQHLWTW